MGNCTSKKSGKLSKLSNLTKKPFHKKMDAKETIQTKPESRGLSTKIAPCSKGEATSFGFKRRSQSSLPTPVILTNRVGEMRQETDGSSVESLCHVSSSSVIQPKASACTNVADNSSRPTSGSAVSAQGTVNRFGFRSSTPPRVSRQTGTTSQPKSPGQGCDKSNRSPNPRSRSEGPRSSREARAAFFKDVMQPAGSVQSISNGATLIPDSNPSRFTLQTSQLPRPQFPVRVSDKTFKTVTNYCRRDGPVDSGSSKDASLTEDSGVESQPSTNTLGETDTLHGLDLGESSPAPLPRVNARKLELKMVNSNQFELLDVKQSDQDSNVKIVKPSRTFSTGLVQQRTEQYLQRISGATDSNRHLLTARSPATSPLGTESEEEKVRKDAAKSEKSTVTYLMTDGIGENDELLPGEAMADDISLSISSDEDFSCLGKKLVAQSNSEKQKMENAICVDAMKISHQLKGTKTSQGEDSCFGLLNTEEKIALDEDTLFELSSGSDSSDHKDDKDGQKKSDQLNGSTESPGTPSNGSLSEGRDFLIDDEIADQPQLCFSTHEEVIVEKAMTASGNNNGSEGTVLCGNTLDELKALKNRETRRSSVGTLSPCESIMSDDLMMDFECSNADDIPDGYETNGKMVNSQLDFNVKECSTFPRTRLRAGNERGCGRASSGGSSPASQRSAISRASTEEDVSVRLDKSSYQHMFQDIVSIKTMLLKLNRVLSESDSGIPPPYTEEDASMDLRKQVAFLQQQLQQREAMVQCLQAEVNRNVDFRTQAIARVQCNAATQTERARPISTGPSILHNLPSDTSNMSNRTQRTISESSDDNNRQCVVRSAPADKILEKVKELSFKPVEVLEKERAERRLNNCKNVFKITKIDLVLKSDNYGQSELTARR